MVSNMDKEVRITLRMPDDLHGVIVSIAERNKTSLNGQIVTMLRRCLSDNVRIESLEARIAALESQR